MANGANALKATCPKGHPYDETNTIHGRSRGGSAQRICRTCKNAWMRANRNKRADAEQDAKARLIELRAKAAAKAAEQAAAKAAEQAA